VIDRLKSAPVAEVSQFMGFTLGSSKALADSGSRSRLVC
jgi:hypothetical protein